MGPWPGSPRSRPRLLGCQDGRRRCAAGVRIRWCQRARRREGSMPLPVRPQRGVALVEFVPERLILVGCDEIHAGCDRCLPAWLDLAESAEIIGRIPAFVLGRVEPVERVEADPIALAMGMIDERAQPLVVGLRPGAGIALAALLDHRPAVVPPAPIVGRTAGEELAWRCRRFPMRALRLGKAGGCFAAVRGAEQAQAPAHRHVIVKDLRLGYRDLGRVAALMWV